MSLLLSNAVVTITRRGAGTVLANARAHMSKDTYVAGPEGPIQQRTILLEPATDPAAVPMPGDSVLVVSRNGHPLAPQTRAVIADVDTPSDVSGALATIKLTIFGGFLPA